MIDLLYNITRKGWLKALSFLLGNATFVLILLKAGTFASHFGGKIPYLALLVFYGMAILWIHGIGFEIRAKIWRVLFLPLLGYVIIFPTFLYIVLN